MFVLKNDRLELNISEVGAEIRNLRLDGKEMLWSADPAVWGNCAPICFPVCGGIPEDKYTVGGGKEYPMPKHGFGKISTYEVEASGQNFVTFILKSNDEIKKMYPWEFALRITYTIHGAALDVRYDVDNLDNSTMYFSIGSHEGYSCPEGIEDYDIIFPEKETLDSWVLNGNLLEHRTDRVLFEGNVFPLYYKYFAIDALVFKDVKSRSAVLRNRKTGRSVEVKFDGMNFLVMWTRPGAPYICIEPWCGVQGMIDDGIDITQKEGIEALEAGKRFTRTHSIHF